MRWPVQQYHNTRPHYALLWRHYWSTPWVANQLKHTMSFLEFLFVLWVSEKWNGKKWRWANLLTETFAIVFWILLSFFQLSGALSYVGVMEKSAFFQPITRQQTNRKLISLVGRSVLRRLTFPLLWKLEETSMVSRLYTFLRTHLLNYQEKRTSKDGRSSDDLPPK